MTTVIRPEVSKKNKYHIDKHRGYELKHFCLQYPVWKRRYFEIDDLPVSTSIVSPHDGYEYSDPTKDRALRKASYSQKMDLVEQAAIAADAELYHYILKAVTEGLTYTYFQTRGIPCSRDTYYDRYRKFFWILDRMRD